MKFIFLLFVCHFLVVCYCQTRPQISTFFDANLFLEVRIKKDNSTFRGDGYWRVDQPKGLGVENFFFHNRSQHQAFRDLFRLQRYDLGEVYEMEDNTTCNATAVDGTMPNEFAWVSKATYKGQVKHHNRPLDLWELTVGYATLGLMVDDSNTNVPVILSRDTPDFVLNMEFAHYTPDHPDSKWFAVPSKCQQDEIFVEEDVYCVERSGMTSRAQAWVNAHVPYNQGGTYNGYREDCSGYVSMCWDTSRPGYTTFSMPSIANKITHNELQPGDALLCVTEHVVLFGGWADSGHTQYYGYEETKPGTGTIKSVVPYPYWYNTACFQPYRYGWVC